ncbi:MAG TPA: DEAD/DEAH box helicase family protein [archaeon]|nr:DEAD/DEAH box helicase family protein [archaeon]
MTEIRTDDLVLKVKTNVDIKKFDISKYEEFLDRLCGDREYQKESIKVVLRFLLGGEYNNIEELAKENFENRKELQDFYKSFQKFSERLEFSDKLACTVDLATATGKSWVMYGVAQIMLCEGIVDRVLILCPSLTIERELHKKFDSFSINEHLRESLMDIDGVVFPRVIFADETIRNGYICIENVHATYKRTGSSIYDSLKGRGDRTLILNDEAHHILQKKLDKDMKKWKEFLISKDFNFKFIVNFSGTPYIDNDYFTDVVYRYSLIQAMDERRTKNIRYVVKDPAKKFEHKMQEVVQNHEANRKKYSIKPITIFVAQKISRASELADDIKIYLVKEMGVSKENAEKKVIAVTSSPEHEKNLELLKYVDDKNNPVEFITSVSMLSEGWDVKNVFQIVPDEKRAFDSKLLVAQVLGRGLRIPEGMEQPTVTVLNHDAWTPKINEIVNDIIGGEDRLQTENVLSKFNFELDQINYEKIQVNKKTQKIEHIKIPEHVALKTQVEEEVMRTEYLKVKEKLEQTERWLLKHKMWSVEEAVNDIFNKFRSYDSERGTSHAKELTKDKIKSIIEKSLRKIGVKDKISDENKITIENALNVIRRDFQTTTKIEMKSKKPFQVNTKEIRSESIRPSELQRTKAIMFTEESLNKSSPENLKVVKDSIKEAVNKFVLVIKNSYCYKCQLNITILSHSNEIKFAELLTDENEKYYTFIDAWIKSVNSGFYSIPYRLRTKTRHTKWPNFNPDFFMKSENDILIVEIKGDEDISEENQSKLIWAETHISELNSKQNKRKYYFYFLSPEDFSKFFEEVIKKGNRKYESSLMAQLRSLQE